MDCLIPVRIVCRKGEDKMKSAFLVIATAIFVATAFSSVSQARPDTRQMSCGQARDLVRHRGVVVLTTGGQTYDRFVSHGGYCAYGEYPERAFVRTRNRQECFIGYICADRQPLWHDD
jgi:hypothetical protein